jgi:dihydrofolate reductase
MRSIVYYVASSLDGYICGDNGNIEGFVSAGKGVETYMNDLASFDTVIMGRATYEFGYRFGLQPGQKAYPHMRHYIFSDNLVFKNADPEVTVCPMNIQIVKDLKAGAGSDIYLCGGGRFAGWLLCHELIDLLKIKLNPIILGQGVKLFEGVEHLFTADLLETTTYDHGMMINTYRLQYLK